MHGLSVRVRDPRRVHLGNKPSCGQRAVAGDNATTWRLLPDQRCRRCVHIANSPICLNRAADRKDAP